MKPVMMLVTIVVVAILIAVIALLVQNKRKEKYTNGVRLGPLLSSPNEETYDVLEWSLGGFGGSPRKSC